MMMACGAEFYLPAVAELSYIDTIANGGATCYVGLASNEAQFLTHSYLSDIRFLADVVTKRNGGTRFGQRDGSSFD